MEKGREKRERESQTRKEAAVGRWNLIVFKIRTY